MSERDKFLTEAMGECWHEDYFDAEENTWIWADENNNFSTWEGFGKLWNWAQNQEWCKVWRGTRYASDEPWCWDGNSCYLRERFLNPDRFADAIYEYLKSKEVPK